MFEGSSSLNMNTYRDLSTGEWEALVDFHMLAAERCYEVAETGF